MTFKIKLLLTVVTMFIQRNTKRVGSKIYHSILVVESFRQNKKVCRRVLANISKLPPSAIIAIDAALKGGDTTSALISRDKFSFESGTNFGGLWALKKIAEFLSIAEVLG